MSAWQQIGRAGRGWDKDAFVLFYAMNDPIDRFVVSNLNAFLEKPFDELVVDPGNEELIGKHLPSLLEEAGGRVSPSEKSILGPPFYDVASKDTGTIPAGYKPQQHLNLRGGIGQSFKLKRRGEELGQISAMRRFREAYIGAIFPFFGLRYHVRSHEEQTVNLEESDQFLRTEPGFYTILTRSDFFNGLGYGGHLRVLRILEHRDEFPLGIKLVDERSSEVIRSGGDNDALFPQ